MAAPVSLLKGARAFARDMPREAMAPGFLWDVVDFVPATIDAPLTSRGAWVYETSVTSPTGDWDAGILAPFSSGEKLLASSGGTVYDVAPLAISGRGTVPLATQNPVMLFDQTIWLGRDGTGNPVTPYVLGPTGTSTALPIFDASTRPDGVRKVKFGTTWGEYFVGGNAPGQEDTVFWSPPDDVTLPWDQNALWRTAGTVTGLAALRNQIFVFHASSIERLRGTRPPAGTNKGDMVLETLFKQVGTTESRTIAYWKESVLFADEHGVHMTDGSMIRNLVQDGQIQSYWRNFYGQKSSVCATVFSDYYIVTIWYVERPVVPLAAEAFSDGEVKGRPDIPDPPWGKTRTLVCDLNTRRWFRFSNVLARSMWASGGTTGMERFWGGVVQTGRLARYSPMFYPLSGSAIQTDGNGTPVAPSFETPFYKLSNEGRKRVRFLYLSYDARNGTVGNTPMLGVGYMLNPQDASFTSVGYVPVTSRYTRYRLPVGRVPYGIAFSVAQINPAWFTRISDLAVDAHAIERSRI